MSTCLTYVWSEAKKLPRLEKIKLMEQLLQSLRVDEDFSNIVSNWDDMYGIGKGIWETDAQEYVNQIREDRL